MVIEQANRRLNQSVNALIGFGLHSTHGLAVQVAHITALHTLCDLIANHDGRRGDVALG